MEPLVWHQVSGLDFAADVAGLKLTVQCAGDDQFGLQVHRRFGGPANSLIGQGSCRNIATGMARATDLASNWITPRKKRLD
jgi:hypothetical protein